MINRSYIYKFLKNNYVIPLSVLVGYVGYVGYSYYRTICNNVSKNKYICGAVNEIDNNDKDLKEIVTEFLLKHHNYDGNYEILLAKSQVVAGIKYTVEIKKEGQEDSNTYTFVYKVWEEEKFHISD